MDRDALLEQLSEDILAYVMHGSFPERHLVQEIAPDGFADRFDDYETLVRLHFVLKPAVVDFVERLPKRLRSIKTQTENVSTTTRGAVEGRIDWAGTVRERYARNPRDRSLFVCENRTENYDIDENVVLKRLLALVHETLQDCQPYFEREYDWVTERWKESTDLVETMREVVERNVHVRRIRRPEVYEPTDRMLQTAAQSRSEIYREAAALIEEYQRTLAGEPEAITNLLADTAITPDDDETLFELFVLFRYIAAVERMTDENFELQTITSGSQEVARLSTNGDDIVLYHDNSARDRGVSFESDVSEKPSKALSRTERIEREARAVADSYFRNRTFRSATGRPDVIVLEVQSENSNEYLITEVKHSKRPETIQRGISETLEYLAFLRQNGTLVHDDESMFGNGSNGVLVVQDLPDDETAPIDEQRSIKILQASEVDQKIEYILREILD
ncbi:hypothetical protein GBQ70_02340 [Halomicrobium sp. ZPS1]|uniref:Uncharacterized protein n=3 Tax=Haloarculaceae TaxID=1963268 RepID=C7P1M9_HALMD|nr:hypothetical protein Hmuk_3014 [Halomicrobium mukohataei DSM 12286]QCD64532.1 hypothetical protein E5139_02340 [Halomicrobium mukohataei]QFR19338.1 hypothetical protein GBQ70_02340 [Halomicrobium sp. ZPS1]